MGVGTDHSATLDAYVKATPVKHLLLSDFRRQVLRQWDAVNTDEKSPTFNYAKRAYFVLDKTGTVKYVKVQQNALELLDPSEVVKAVKASGAS